MFRIPAYAKILVGLTISFACISTCFAAVLFAPKKVFAAADPPCKPGETVKYIYVNGSENHYEDSAGNRCDPNAAQRKSADDAANVTTPLECTWGEQFYNPYCWIRAGVTYASDYIVWAVSWLVVLTGWFFDYAFYYTVLNFDKWFSGDVYTAIGLAWTFFRDVANIIIIGLFVFIAISMILGSKTYGQKVLIARVLVVAILINFSFLFTRIVINASNSMAKSFAASLIQKTPQNPDGISDVAGKFTTLMGVKSINETGGALFKIANKYDSTWYALLHALLAIVLMLGASLVFLFAAIQLLLRAGMFIFLLITAALAFSTYLLPGLAQGEVGWRKWWSVLIREAFFAPIFCLFLIAIFNISDKLVIAIRSGSLAGGAKTSMTLPTSPYLAQVSAATTNPSPTTPSGNSGKVDLGILTSSPDDSVGDSSLISYVMIGGLLFGALRISRGLGTMAGRVAIGTVSRLAGGAARVGAGALGLGGALGRTAFGRGAAKVSDADDAQKARAKEKSMRGILSGAYAQYARLGRGPVGLSRGAEDTLKKGSRPPSGGLGDGGQKGKQVADDLSKKKAEEQVVRAEAEKGGGGDSGAKDQKTAEAIDKLATNERRATSEETRKEIAQDNNSPRAAVQSVKSTREEELRSSGRNIGIAKDEASRSSDALTAAIERKLGADAAFSGAGASAGARRVPAAGPDLAAYKAAFEQALGRKANDNGNGLGRKVEEISRAALGASSNSGTNATLGEKLRQLGEKVERGNEIGRQQVEATKDLGRNLDKAA